ncbi:MAG: AMP-binding protein [Methanoregula sp.]|nr:AMP-binding protein [Methanoregula sp.]
MIRTFYLPSTILCFSLNHNTNGQSLCPLGRDVLTRISLQWFEKGDRVLIILPCVPEWWTSTVALIKRGAVYCQAPTMLRLHDLKYRINIADSRIVITIQEHAEKIDEWDPCR